MKEFLHREKLMGCDFSLGIVAKNKNKADEWLRKGVDEIKRIEALLSEYQDSSITSFINQSHANSVINIPEEISQLILRCQQISDLTKGTFDITSGPLKKLYSFKRESIIFPSKKAIHKTLKKIGYKNIHVNKGSITKHKRQMHISFNAIGKGYAADCVKKLWQENGIDSGFINSSGDLCAFGKKADDSPWQIGIANPNKQVEALLNLPIDDMAVATSGDYEQFFIYNGKRYSHNIDPRTGIPIQGINSVTIISPSAELSDALATAVYVMGEKKGIDFINQLPKTHGIIINDKNQIFYSKDIIPKNNQIFEHSNA